MFQHFYWLMCRMTCHWRRRWFNWRWELTVLTVPDLSRAVQNMGFFSGCVFVMLWPLLCICRPKTVGVSIIVLTHTFNGLLSVTTRVSRYQKGKNNLDFTEARDSEWQCHQLGYMQVCISLQTDNRASTPPLNYLQAGCPSPNMGFFSGRVFEMLWPLLCIFRPKTVVD